MYFAQGTMDADAAGTGPSGVPAQSELGEHDQCLLQCLIEQLLVTTHGVQFSLTGLYIQFDSWHDPPSEDVLDSLKTHCVSDQSPGILRSMLSPSSIDVSYGAAPEGVMSGIAAEQAAQLFSENILMGLKIKLIQLHLNGDLRQR